MEKVHNKTKTTTFQSCQTGKLHRSISHYQNCILSKGMALCSFNTSTEKSSFDLLAPEFIIKNSLYPTVLFSREAESNDITGIWGQCS